MKKFKLSDRLKQKFRNNEYSVVKINMYSGEYTILEEHVKSLDEAGLLAIYEMGRLDGPQLIILFPGSNVGLTNDEKKTAIDLAYKYRPDDMRTGSFATALKNKLDEIRKAVLK